MGRGGITLRDKDRNGGSDIPTAATDPGPDFGKLCGRAEPGDEMREVNVRPGAARLAPREYRP